MSTLEIIPYAANSSRAKAVRQDDWNRYWPYIETLYARRPKLTMDVICRLVNERYGANINEGQLQRKLTQSGKRRNRSLKVTENAVQEPRSGATDPAPSDIADRARSEIVTLSDTFDAPSNNISSSTTVLGIENPDPGPDPNFDSGHKLDLGLNENLQSFGAASSTSSPRASTSSSSSTATGDDLKLRTDLSLLVADYRSSCSFIPPMLIDPADDRTEQVTIRFNELATLGTLCCAVQGYSEAFDVYFTMFAEVLDVQFALNYSRLWRAISGCLLYASTPAQKVFSSSLLSRIELSSLPKSRSGTELGVTLQGYLSASTQRSASIRETEGSPACLNYGSSVLLATPFIINHISKEQVLPEAHEPSYVREHILDQCSSLISSVKYAWDTCTAWFRENSHTAASLLRCARFAFPDNTPPDSICQYAANRLCAGLLAEQVGIVRISCDEPCQIGGSSCPIMGTDMGGIVLSTVFYFFLRSCSGTLAVHQRVPPDDELELHLSTRQRPASILLTRTQAIQSSNTITCFTWSLELLTDHMLKLLMPLESDRSNLTQPRSFTVRSIANSVIVVHPDRDTFSRVIYPRHPQTTGIILGYPRAVELGSTYYRAVPMTGFYLNDISVRMSALTMSSEYRNLRAEQNKRSTASMPVRDVASQSLGSTTSSKCGESQRSLDFPAQKRSSRQRGQSAKQLPNSVETDTSKLSLLVSRNSFEKLSRDQPL